MTIKVLKLKDLKKIISQKLLSKNIEDECSNWFWY